MHNLSSETKKAIEFLHSEFAGLQTGRASSALVEGIQVFAYGGTQPLRNLATISTPDAKTIQISPFDKTLVASVEKAIRDANVGLNPNNNGNSIILNLPPMTEERRKDLVKLVHRYAEDAKVAVRNARQDAMKAVDAAGLSEDEARREKDQIQKEVDKANEEIETTAKHKETDIMKV